MNLDYKPIKSIQMKTKTILIIILLSMLANEAWAVFMCIKFEKIEYQLLPLQAAIEIILFVAFLVFIRIYMIEFHKWLNRTYDKTSILMIIFVLSIYSCHKDERVILNKHYKNGVIYQVHVSCFNEFWFDIKKDDTIFKEIQVYQYDYMKYRLGDTIK